MRGLECRSRIFDALLASHDVFDKIVVESCALRRVDIVRVRGEFCDQLVLRTRTPERELRRVCLTPDRHHVTRKIPILIEHCVETHVPRPGALRHASVRSRVSRSARCAAVDMEVDRAVDVDFSRHGARRRAFDRRRGHLHTGFGGASG